MKNISTFAPANEKQTHLQNKMVPWMSGLVTGLQNRLHPFESGRHLQKRDQHLLVSFFVSTDFMAQVEFVQSHDSCAYLAQFLHQPLRLLESTRGAMA